VFKHSFVLRQTGNGQHQTTFLPQHQLERVLFWINNKTTRCSEMVNVSLEQGLYYYHSLKTSAATFLLLWNFGNVALRAKQTRPKRNQPYQSDIVPHRTHQQSPLSTNHSVRYSKKWRDLWQNSKRLWRLMRFPLLKGMDKSTALGGQILVSTPQQTAKHIDFVTSFALTLSPSSVLGRGGIFIWATDSSRAKPTLGEESRFIQC